MQKETWKRCILFVLVLGLRSAPVWAEDGLRPGASVTIAVHNHAGVSVSTLAQAEQTASSIFRQAGMDVEWVNCEPTTEAKQAVSSCRLAEFPRHLQLSIAPRSKNLTESVFGIAFLGEDGSGCYSDVFFEPAEELHERLHLNLGTVLGHVVAHEIAHLLLGTNAHSETGIMRPKWNEHDLANVSKGELLFTRAQGEKMRDKVAASLCRNAKVVVTPGSGGG